MVNWFMMSLFLELCFCLRFRLRTTVYDIVKKSEMSAYTHLCEQILIKMLFVSYCVIL
jgi:hypothetical protein